MAVNKVNIYVSKIHEDLNNGFTWLKKDDLGYGSIEEKYSANERQIATIRLHPALKNAETNIIIFNVIDDLDSASAKKVKNDVSSSTSTVNELFNEETTSNDNDADNISAFNNL